MTTIKYTNEIGDNIELEVRNVGTVNPKAAIQIAAKVTPQGAGKRKFFELSIPASCQQEFMKAVTVEQVTEHDPVTCHCHYLGNDMWSCGHVDGQAGDKMDEAVIEKLTTDKVIEKLIGALDDMTDRVEEEHIADHEDGFTDFGLEPGDHCPTCRSIRDATTIANGARTHEPPPIIIEVQGGLIQNVTKLDSTIKVIVRDYDVEGTDDDDHHVTKDPAGVPCCEQIW